MEEYTLLRQFADSWMLLVLFLFFVGIFFWVFRPGAGKIYSDTADIPFKYEHAPKNDAGDPAQEETRT